MSEDDFLRRWSRRKQQARKGEALEEPARPIEPVEPPPAVPVSDLPAIAEEPPLPPVESLTPESDFTPFMRPKVDGSVRNAAMRALFKDPRYNVMDGLDVYIDDYSKPDPLPEGWLEKMNQVARLGAYEPPVEAEEGPGNPQVAQSEVPVDDADAESLPPPASPEGEKAAPKDDL